MKSAELARLWKSQQRWQWWFFLPIGIVAIAAFVAPKTWQTSSGAGLFYLLSMTLAGVLLVVWVRKWAAYWRARHQVHGDSFWAARKREGARWWTTHPWQGRLAVLLVFLATVVAYALIRWPNGGVASVFLIAGLATALVVSRLTARHGH